ALDGSALTIDHRSNELFYQRPGVLASEIIRGDAPAAPAPADQFLAAIENSVRGERTASAEAASPTSDGAEASSARTMSAPQTESGGVKTYPMEDPNPGQEPPL